MKWDAVICGAGPAGVKLASLHRGRRAIVLDPYPFYKVCGELVTLREAYRLGAPILRKGEAVEVRTPYGRRAHPVQTALIDREAWLSRTLADSGAELIRTPARRLIVRDGVCVGVLADREYYADMVYDCTGPTRALASSFHRAAVREYALCYQERVKARYPFEEPLAYYDPKLAPGGYAWAFPRGDGELNIGLGAWPWVKDLKLRLELFTRVVGVDVAKSLQRRGARLFLGFSRRPEVRGLRFAGEANGSCDPYTGSGIMQAVIDAEKVYYGERRSSGLLRKFSSLFLRHIPAAYLQALELTPLRYIPYYP